MFASMSPTQQMFGAMAFDKQTTRRQRAAEAFDKAHARGLRQQRFGRLFGRQRRLLDLDEVERLTPVGARFDAGIRLVPITAIRGSEGREADFDADFNPLQEHTRERWISVAVARQSGVTLPPVKLVQLGDAYYVRDGHHRISVARYQGQNEIEAEVTVWRMAEAA